MISLNFILREGDWLSVLILAFHNTSSKGGHLECHRRKRYFWSEASVKSWSADEEIGVRTVGKS